MTQNRFPLPIDKFLDRPTPFYYYDMDLLNATLESIRVAMGPHTGMHYAIKANANPVILQAISSAGFGADCVSGGEIATAIREGFAPSSIVYSGVGKTDLEIAMALRARIGCFNIESIEELKIVSDIAAGMGKMAPIALRVNPNIDAHTHHYITTGLEENKFGIDMRILDKAMDLALELPALDVRGLHFHIGSQITTMEPYALLCERINSIVEHFAGRGIEIREINVGGGLGVDYEHPDKDPIPDFKAYFDTFRHGLKHMEGKKLRCELGRAVVAQCGSLISRVIYVKQGFDKRFVILDAGMNDLLRPALYGAHHVIQNLSADHDSPKEKYDVVGPICESADVFATDLSLPTTDRGDLFAIRSAGAYGESMSSTYNIRRLVGSYL